MIFGSPLDNYIIALRGNDTVNGGGGNDTMMYDVKDWIIYI